MWKSEKRQNTTLNTTRLNMGGFSYQNCKTVHCCYCIYKNVLSFFAFLYKFLADEPEKYQKKFFWTLQIAQKMGESSGIEPMIFWLQ